MVWGCGLCTLEKLSLRHNFDSSTVLCIVNNMLLMVRFTFVWTCLYNKMFFGRERETQRMYTRLEKAANEGGQLLFGRPISCVL